MKIGMNRVNLALVAFFALLMVLFSWRVFRISETELPVFPDMTGAETPGFYEELEIVGGEMIQTGTDETRTTLRFEHAVLEPDKTFKFERPTLIIAKGTGEGVEIKADRADGDLGENQIHLAGSVYGVSGERHLWADDAIYHSKTGILEAKGIPEAIGEEGYVIYNDGKIASRARKLKTDSKFEKIKLEGETQVTATTDLLKGRKKDDAKKEPQ